MLVVVVFLLVLPSTQADASLLDPNSDSTLKTFIVELKEQAKSNTAEIKQSALENIRAIDNMTLAEKIDFIKALKDPEVLKQNITVNSSKNVMEPENPPLEEIAVLNTSASLMPNNITTFSATPLTQSVAKNFQFYYKNKVKMFSLHLDTTFYIKNYKVTKSISAKSYIAYKSPNLASIQRVDIQHYVDKYQLAYAKAKYQFSYKTSRFGSYIGGVKGISIKGCGNGVLCYDNSWTEN
ncbi:hypothetical protein GTN30_10500 [Macrococcoides canis]|uniref:Uncharacterized protein n=2 Tax=Macrococcoides canis TaxID=1855823 RepID=A0AAE6X316_9STAP|nr:hypothetical protein [Macrococcus canis]QIH79074.1 hypothetical protein GTN30_10500 [Macrococcus canis]